VSRLRSSFVHVGLLTLFLLSDCLIGASATAAQLTLNWTDTSSNEEGFKIERRDANAAASTFAEIKVGGANVTSYMETSGRTPHTSPSSCAQR
jgi:hypothetical protein